MKSYKLIFYIVTILNSYMVVESANVLNYLEMRSALNFSKAWANSARMSIIVMLPTISDFNMRDMVLIAKEMGRNSKRDLFFKFARNDSHYNKNYTEVVWYPLSPKFYNATCDIFNMINDDRLQNKHILLFDESKLDAVKRYEFCKLRFDSNIVVYYRSFKSNKISAESQIIQFEEIFKIKEDSIIKSNRLANIDTNTTISINTGLNTHIWQRRKNLGQIKFSAISEVFAHCVTKFQTVNSENGETKIEPIGYFPDIMKHLMVFLNFSITTNMPEKRANWTYLVLTIAKRHYDIGYAWFNFDLNRIKIVDFSTGILTSVTGMFYVKRTNDFTFDMYMKPLYPNTWMSLISFIALMTVGYVIFALLMLRKQKENKISIFTWALQQSSNFALRSIIGKRLSIEPTWNYSRIAFFVLVLSGFLLITFYRAVFVSFVAVDFEAPPVNSFKEILNSDYHLAVAEDSAFDDITKQVNPPADLQNLEDKGKIKRFSCGPDCYVEKMLRGKTEASKSILLDSREGLISNPNYPCNIDYIKSTPKDAILTVGMIFKKNWPYTKLFNFHLLQMRESGMLDHILHKYKKKIKTTCPNEQRISIVLKKFTPVGMEKTIFLYILISLGLFFSSVVLISELYIMNEYGK